MPSIVGKVLMLLILYFRWACGVARRMARQNVQERMSLLHF